MKNGRCVLYFEKPLYELNDKIEELKNMAVKSGVKMDVEDIL
jgi:hypothetical protein